LKVELAFVIDTCFHSKFKSDAKTTSNDIGYALQRIYWAQVGLQINRRYTESLASNSDLRISIVVVGFVLLTVSIYKKNIMLILTFKEQNCLFTGAGG
jgi:hypothetical protein